MIRTAMLSFWHVHAKGHTKQAIDHPNIDLVAAWDEDPHRGRARAAEWDIPFVEGLDGLLARPDIDAVIVQTPTSLHHDIIIRAAKAGKHIFSDKVLAPTIKEANEIVAAVDAAKVVLFVGMPYLYYDFTARLKTILDAGEIGTLVSARIMNCHGMAIEDTLPPGFYSAKEASGGALIDMCHAVYLVPCLLGGLPTSAYASFAHMTKREVEDSAAVIFDYDSGARAIVEAGFVTKGAPRVTLELHGTEGSVLFRADSHPRGEGAPAGSIFIERIGDQTEFVAVELGKPSPVPLSQWVQHIVDGTRPDENIKYSLDLSRLIEAAYLSAGQGKAVPLASLHE